MRVSWTLTKTVYGRYDKWGDWVDSHDKEQTRHLWVPIAEVFNVSDYNLGDYKMFLCDRALQGSYLKWASQLLHAEDEARKAKGRDVSLKSKKKGWKKERIVGHDGEEYIMESTGGVAPLGEGL